MNVNTMIKKTSVLMIVAVLIIGLNFSIYVSANFNKDYENDGIWIDEFNNDADITLDNCTLNTTTKTITLRNGSSTFAYNYAKQPKSVKAYYHSFASRFAISQLVSPEISPGDEYSENEMKKLKEIDNDPIEAESIPLTIGYWFSPAFHFQFKTNQDKDNIENITIKWWFGDYKDDAYIEEIGLWVWEYGSSIPHWTNLHNIAYTEENLNGTDANIDYTEDDLSIFKNWISDEGIVDIIIAGIPIENELENPVIHTDFVELEIETKEGYYSQGKVTSSPIEIESSKFGGWESVFWSSSKPSSASNVTIQILDQDNKLINELSSTSSPLDISPIENKTIKLRAVLNSKSAGVTPKLYYWGIIWQKPNGYQDSFSTNYKLDGNQGIKIESGHIEINEYYSDWSFFGKNSANQRAYDGSGIESRPQDVYWSSTGDIYGGGFRHIVSKNGKVYVPGSDKEIHVFNAIKDSSTRNQKPIYSTNNSNISYEVDAAIAINDDYLIIGTCDIGGYNKIYALNLSDNLTGIKWTYPPLDDDTIICFSAPPTIHDDRLFITSWSGKIWDVALFSFLSNFIPQNNKLIGLDITDGTKLWEPISLPAGSFSAPAVGNEMVYVGCQNMWGSSLFAYDIETGKEVWNKSVGIIGKSSPVYADGKVFVLTRQNVNLSNKGENNIVAVDANSGEILWNKTIGDTKTTTLLNLLKGFDFLKSLYSLAPISSPAYYNNTLFVVTPDGKLMGLSPDGEEKFSFNLSRDLLFDYYITSPLIVGDYLYVVNSGYILQVYDTTKLTKNTDPAWEPYKIETPLRTMPPTYVDTLASPIMADGLLLLSVTVDTLNLSGNVYCIGNYSKNTMGYVISDPIHVPTGHWWNNFSADNTSTKNNTVTYKILNENNEPLLTGLNGSTIDISSLNDNVIKLYARLNILNESEAEPTVDKWEVTWYTENTTPEFIDDSFRSSGGREGWYSTDLSECSIEVKDNHTKSSGIDVSSARFKIGYVNSKNENKISSWLVATSNDKSGVKQTTIHANFSKLDLNIRAIKDITFQIKDLAGNKKESETTAFKVDIKEPSSSFVGTYNNQYKNSFTISCSASDNINGSGIQSVTIKYRFNKSTDDNFEGDWITYEEQESPFDFTFATNASGYYQIISVAEDKASNKETIDSSKIEDGKIFLFDKNKPVMNTTFGTVRSTEIPVFEIEIFDDFKLDSLSYKLDNETTWTPIKDNIDNNIYSKSWQVPQDFWVSIDEEDERRIYFKITDFIGNEYVTTTSNSPVIIKDENISKFSIDLSDIGEWHWENKFTIRPIAPEGADISEIKLFYKYSKEDKEPESNYTEYGTDEESPFEITFKPDEGDGYYWFYMEIEDTSGVIYEAYSGKANISSFPTTLFVLLLLVAIILIVLTLLILFKMKKRP